MRNRKQHTARACVSFASITKDIQYSQGSSLTTKGSFLAAKKKATATVFNIKHGNGYLPKSVIQ